MAFELLIYISMLLKGLIAFLLFTTVAPTYASNANLSQSLCAHSLDSRVITFILNVNNSDSYSYDLKINQILMINRKAVQVIAPVGHGGEGEAYLSYGENRLMIVKIFKATEKFERAVEAYQTFSRYLPAVIDSDPKRKLLLLEYFEGVPVDSITSEGRIYGLSKYEIEGIAREYESWVRFTYPRSKGHTGLSFWDVNTLYSFKDETFRLVDPF